MSVLFIVVPIALVIAIASVSAFIWAVRNGQMDDLDSPAIRMLHDDQPVGPSSPPTDDESSAVEPPSPMNPPDEEPSFSEASRA